MKKQVVFLAPIFFIFWLAAWALSSPVGSSPDDDYHLTSIWCSVENDSCVETQNVSKKNVSVALLEVNCFAFKSNQSAVCQNDIQNINIFPLVETARGSFTQNYPTFYYSFHSYFVTQNLLQSALIMRLINILLVIVPAFITLTLLGKKIAGKITFGLVTTLIPLGAFLIASNNPSSWAVISVPMAFLALYGVFRYKGKRKVILIVLYVLFLLQASGSRADSAFYAIIASVVAIIISLGFIKKQFSVLLIPFMGMLFSLSLFLSAGQSSVSLTGLPTDEIDISYRNGLDVFLTNLVRIPYLLSGSFGTWKLGWLDTSMPSLVWIFAGLCFLFVTINGIWRLRLSIILSSSFIVLLIISIPLYVLQKGLNFVGEQVQPRYILPLITLLVVVLVVEKQTLLINPKKVVFWSLLFFLSLSNSIALFANIHRYSFGSENSIFALFFNGSGWWLFDNQLITIGIWAIGTLALPVALKITNSVSKI